MGFPATIKQRFTRGGITHRCSKDVMFQVTDHKGVTTYRDASEVFKTPARRETHAEDSYGTRRLITGQPAYLWSKASCNGTFTGRYNTSVTGTLYYEIKFPDRRSGIPGDLSVYQRRNEFLPWLHWNGVGPHELPQLAGAHVDYECQCCRSNDTLPFKPLRCGHWFH